MSIPVDFKSSQPSPLRRVFTNLTQGLIPLGTKCTWDFGDGSPQEVSFASPVGPVHDFPVPGAYKITLWVVTYPGNLVERGNRWHLVGVTG